MIALLQLTSALMLPTVLSKQHSDSLPLCVVACCRLTEACALTCITSACVACLNRRYKSTAFL
jgi:hypothetical protein